MTIRSGKSNFDSFDAPLQAGTQNDLGAVLRPYNGRENSVH